MPLAWSVGDARDADRARPAPRRGRLDRPRVPRDEPVAADPSTLPLRGRTCSGSSCRGRAGRVDPRPRPRAPPRRRRPLARARRERRRPRPRRAGRYPREARFYRRARAPAPRVRDARATPGGDSGPWVRGLPPLPLARWSAGREASTGSRSASPSSSPAASLLGLEIAASRVLAPYFGSSLFVWGALIGVVLTGLSIGYWAGGALADRLAVAVRCFVGAIALGAGLVLAIPVVDEWVLEQVVALGSRPAARPARRRDRPLRPAERRARVGLADRRAPRCALARPARDGPPAASSRSRRRAASPGTFATAFWLVPEFGTDQVLAVGRRCVLARGRGVRRAAPAALARRGRARRRRGRARSSPSARSSPATERARRSRAPPRELVAALPRARRADAAQARSRRGRARRRGLHGARGHATRATTASSSSTTRTRATSASTARSRAGCTSTTRSARASTTPTTSHLGLAYNPDAKRVLFVGLGGGSAPKRIWRDFPDARAQAVELDPEVVDDRLPLVRAAARARALDVEVDDGRRFLAAHTTTAGT